MKSTLITVVCQLFCASGSASGLPSRLFENTSLIPANCGERADPFFLVSPSLANYTCPSNCRNIMISGVQLHSTNCRCLYNLRHVMKSSKCHRNLSSVVMFPGSGEQDAP